MQIEKKDTTWALEYSFNESTFFAAPLEEILSMNRRCFLEGWQHDFMILNLFETKEELEKYAEHIRGIVKRKILYTDIYARIRIKK